MDSQQPETPQFLSPSEAVAYFVGKPNEKTIRDWMQQGVRIRIDGGEFRLRLRCHTEGSRYFTTVEWIREFVESRQYLWAVQRGIIKPEQEPLP